MEASSSADASPEGDGDWNLHQLRQEHLDTVKERMTTSPPVECSGRSATGVRRKKRDRRPGILEAVDVLTMKGSVVMARTADGVDAKRMSVVSQGQVHAKSGVACERDVD
jgi:hypothetical protein